MSDNDDDERLDRAKRIRKMREGDGRDTDDSDDEPAESPEETADEPADHGEQSTATDEETTGEESETMNTGNEGQKESAEEPEVPDVNVPEASTETESTDAKEPTTEDDVSAPLPDTEELEDALESNEATADTATPDEVADTAGPAGALEEESHEEETRVLEFKLGDEYYCLDIDYIEEIVKEETITRVPNTPEYVEGVVDLRGQITTILNPKVTIEKDDISPGGLIIVFDSESFEDQGHIGWVVDDVRQVSPITDDEVNEPPVQEHYINGVIDRDEDEQFVIWAEPSMAMEEAE